MSALLYAEGYISVLGQYKPATHDLDFKICPWLLLGRLKIKKKKEETFCRQTFCRNTM